MSKSKVNIKRVDGVVQGYHVGNGVQPPTVNPLNGSIPTQASTQTPVQGSLKQGSQEGSESGTGVDSSVEGKYAQFIRNHPNGASEASVSNSVSISSPSVSSSTKLAESMVKINTNYPYPQANSLSKVASVVDAVSGLADTDEGVAAAINVVPRQGAYYSTAAAYLGLLAETGSAPRTWGLTGLGAAFLEADSSERVNILNTLVSQIPAADMVGLEEEMYTVDEIEIGENLSTATASRRAAALNAWVKTLSSETASNSLSLESDGVAERIIDAASIASEGRERARLRARVEPVYEVCPDCFMQKSASGGCGC